MVSLIEADRNNRHALIEEFCKTPQDITAIAKQMGVSYYTARNDVKTMLQAKRLRNATEKSANGGMTYITGEIRPMPEFHQSSANRMVTLKDLASAAPQTVQYGSLSSAAAVGVITIAADLLHKVAFMESSGTIEPKHLAELRRELANYQLHLKSITSLAQQMLDSHVLWNPERLAAIALDEQWDAKAAEEWHGLVLDTLSQKARASAVTTEDSDAN